MPTESNPYAAPRSDLNTGIGASGAFERPYWRSGALLLVRHGVTLPSRCVKCNAEVADPLKKARFHWHHQAWFVLLLLNVILYAVVSLVVRRHADVTFGLCTEHRRRRKHALLMGMAGAAFAIALFVAAFIAEQPALAPLALLAFFASLIYAVVKGRTLLPVRIDRSGAQFKGCGEDFLASLPNS